MLNKETYGCEIAMYLVANAWNWVGRKIILLPTKFGPEGGSEPIVPRNVRHVIGSREGSRYAMATITASEHAVSAQSLGIC
jgi:hypothetical protein